MTTQESTFFGERLRQAREARGMTKATLAELVGVSPTMVTNYETEKNNVPLDKAMTFSRYLRQPVGFFLRPPVSGPAKREPARFRSLKLSYIKQAPVLHKLGWLGELVGVLDHFVELPAVSLPSPPVRRDADPLPVSDIEAFATEVRDAWRLGQDPIRDLTFTAEQNGVIVQAFSFEPETIDGVSDWSFDGRPLILLNEARRNLVRGRFNLAHELGHICLHRAMEDADLAIVGTKVIEAEASRFAGALLLPAEPWRMEARAARTLASLQALKLRWKVSVKAMAYRSRDLELITDERFAGLMKQYSSKGWQRGEPFDRDWEVEKPTLLRECAELVADHPMRAHVMQQLPELDDGDLAHLLGSEALCGTAGVSVAWREGEASPTEDGRQNGFGSAN